MSAKEMFEIPLSKEHIKFNYVSGERVFDLCMELDRTQQENTQLKQEKEELIKWLEEQIEYNSKLYLSNVRYEKVCEDVLSKLKGR